MKHCCREMESHILSGDVKIKYNSKFREYGIPVKDGGSAVQNISFCPWCGKQLPSSLRDKWFEVIDGLGLEPGDPEITEKYKTESWWQDQE